MVRKSEDSVNLTPFEQKMVANARVYRNTILYVAVMSTITTIVTILERF